MNITWLGQGGFLFEEDGSRFVVDPYWSDAVEKKTGFTRLHQPVMPLESLKPDVLLCTHDHLDHYDPETVTGLMRLFPCCKLIGPQSVRRKAAENMIEPERVIVLVPEQAYRIKGWDIIPLPAIHSDPDAIGFLLARGGWTGYITGDTEYAELLSQNMIRQCESRTKPLDALFICINGKYGNMTWQQAFDVVRVVKPQITIPMHYGMFVENTVDPTAFSAVCTQNNIQVQLPIPGLQFIR